MTDTTTKHTPGPWEAILPDDKRGQPVPYYRGLICCVSHEEPSGMLAVVTADGRSVPKSDWEANARLMAAAPDLLAALKDLKALYEFDDGCMSLREYKNARAAIDKATGQ